MKKLLFTLFIILISKVTFCQVVYGGFHRGGTSMEYTEKKKERLKIDLDLTDEQTDFVVAIEQPYQLKVRALKMDTNISEEARQSKIKELDMLRLEKLKTILTTEQIGKLEIYNDDIRKMRWEKSGSQNADK